MTLPSAGQSILIFCPFISNRLIIMNPMINIALSAARDASEKILLGSARLDRLRITNKDPENFSTNMDQDSAYTIISQLHKAYPSHTIESRVGESIAGEEGQPRWIVDPLFGSLNYSQGYSSYGVSIAVIIDNLVNHSVLILPKSNEEYIASRGEGARLNKQKLRVYDENEFQNPLIGFNRGQITDSVSLKIFELLLQQKAQVRISGCSAIDMLLVSTNSLIAGWCEARNSNSEQAAGLILKESGALIGSELGNPDLKSASELFFGAPKIFKNLIKLRQSIIL